MKYQDFSFYWKIISSLCAGKILFLSFTCEDIGVAMVTNMISQLQESPLAQVCSVLTRILPWGVPGPPLLRNRGPVRTLGGQSYKKTRGTKNLSPHSKLSVTWSTYLIQYGGRSVLFRSQPAKRPPQSKGDFTGKAMWIDAGFMMGLMELSK